MKVRRVWIELDRDKVPIQHERRNYMTGHLELINLMILLGKIEWM